MQPAVVLLVWHFREWWSCSFDYLMFTSLFTAISESYQKITGKHNACIISAYLLTCCIEIKFKSIALSGNTTSMPIPSRECTIDESYMFWSIVQAMLGIGSERCSGNGMQFLWVHPNIALHEHEVSFGKPASSECTCCAWSNKMYECNKSYFLFLSIYPSTVPLNVTIYTCT